MDLDLLEGDLHLLKGVLRRDFLVVIMPSSAVLSPFSVFTTSWYDPYMNFGPKLGCIWIHFFVLSDRSSLMCVTTVVHSAYIQAARVAISCSPIAWNSPSVVSWFLHAHQDALKYTSFKLL